MSEVVAYNDAVVNRWLVQHVDNLVPDKYVDILKLGLRTEITSQHIRDEAKYPSELYRELCRSWAHKELFDKSKVLARFVYALKLLNRLKLSEVLTDEFLAEQGIIVSTFDPTDQTEQSNTANFMLHQCLVKICVKLTREQRNNLLTYCAHACRVTRWRFQSIAQLMEWLLHTKINKDDQYVLVEGLMAVEAYDCIEIIVQYRRNNHLSEYNLEQLESQTKIVLNEIQTSESEGGFSDGRLHDRQHAGTSSRLRSVLGKKRHRSGSKDEYTYLDEREELLSTPSFGTDIEITGSDSTIQSVNTTEKSGINLGPPEQVNVLKRRRKKVSIIGSLSFSCLFCILMVAMLVLVSLSVSQFNPNHTKTYRDTEGITQTTLAIVNPFFTKKLTVTDNEKDLQQYRQHTISLSVHESDCRGSAYYYVKSNLNTVSRNNSAPLSINNNALLKRSRPQSESTLIRGMDECFLPDSKTCEFSINSSLILKRRCFQLTALIHPNPNNTLGYVNITLDFAPTLSAAIGFSVVGVLFILMCSCFVLSCCCIIAY